MLGRFDDGVELLERASAIYDELGRPASIARTCAPISADVARLMNDDPRAEAVLRDSCSTLREIENWNHFGTQAATLADTLYALGRYDDAQAWLADAEAHAQPDDLVTEIGLCSVRAKLTAQRGDAAGAEASAREALRLAESTDGLNQRAAVQLALAEVLAVAGRAADAAGARARALAFFEQKGNAAAAARWSEVAAASPGTG
jgi:tetratricopeptide (TPR) repeat protein